MSPEKGGAAPDRRRRRARRDGADTWIPNIAVAAMAVVAVLTAVMVTRSQHGQDAVATAPAPASASQPRLLPAQPIPPEQSAVVRAPALGAEGASPAAARNSTSVLGGASGCTRCGTVETVVAVRKDAKSEPSSYQMHIRMDDGSVRTVEQRGALPAGSRVQVQGDTLRVVPGSG